MSMIAVEMDTSRECVHPVDTSPASTPASWAGWWTAPTALTDEEIARIARICHAWGGEPDAGAYEDLPGFCKSAALEEIPMHGYVLTPGHYVGAEAQEDDGEPFEEQMK